MPCPQYPDASMEPIYTIFIALQDVDDDMVAILLSIYILPTESYPHITCKLSSILTVQQQQQQQQQQ